KQENAVAGLPQLDDRRVAVDDIRGETEARGLAHPVVDLPFDCAQETKPRRQGTDARIVVGELLRRIYGRVGTAATRAVQLVDIAAAPRDETPASLPGPVATDDYVLAHVALAVSRTDHAGYHSGGRGDLRLSP